MGTINIFLTDLRTFRSNFGMTGGFAVFEHFFTRPTKGPRMFRSFIKKDTFFTGRRDGQNRQQQCEDGGGCQTDKISSMMRGSQNQGGVMKGLKRPLWQGHLSKRL